MHSCMTYPKMIFECPKNQVSYSLFYTLVNFPLSRIQLHLKLMDFLIAHNVLNLQAEWRWFSNFYVLFVLILGDWSILEIRTQLNKNFASRMEKISVQFGQKRSYWAHCAQYGALHVQWTFQSNDRSWKSSWFQAWQAQDFMFWHFMI